MTDDYMMALSETDHGRARVVAQLPGARFALPHFTPCSYDMEINFLQFLTKSARVHDPV